MHVHRFSNGLTVLLREHHAAPVATFWVWYRVGSRNETPGLTGISHWVEHMLFKGTPAHPGKTLTRYIDRLGGRWNAFTWKDYTAYHEVLPAEHLGVAITLEADRMRHTIFDPAEVDSERTVIISEREGSENFPSYLLREEVDAAAFKAHSYRYPVIGWKDDLRAITRDDLFRHYRTYYHPTNAVVVAAGAFDAGATLELVRRAFEDIPPGPPVPVIPGREPAQEGERRVVLQRAGGATAYLHLGYHVPEGAHPDLAALLLADGLLSGFKSIVPFDGGGGGRSSRLYRALVETGLATDASSSFLPGIDPALFRITATARAGVDVAAIEARAVDELRRLSREPVGLAELAKVKKQAKAQVVFSRDGVYRTALALGAFTIIDGPEAFDELQQRIDEVTPDDITRVAATYFEDKNRTTGIYLPESGAAAGAAHHSEVFWWSGGTGRASAPAVPITPHTVARVELANGVVVLIREQPGAEMVALHGYVKAGAMFDGERGGMAGFVAGMLQRGTRAKSSQEIAEALESMGAVLAARADMETVSVGLRALREDAVAALEILGEVLMVPTFPPGEVDKARGEILTSIRIGMQDTRQVAERTFRSLAFPPGHPHARFPEGDESNVAALSREELAAFHHERYRPEATLLAIVGDIAAHEAIDTVARLFSSWPRGSVFRLPAIPPIPEMAAPVRRDARLAGKIQSDIVLGTPGLARADPAYYDTMVANLILGQLGLMGRLGDSVRERQGMAYYAYSDLRAGLLAGPWWVRAGVNPKNEERAIASILEEIRRFQEHGPEAAELADARDFLIGSMAVRLETNAGIAQTLADIELYGLGLDYLERYPEIIRSVTPDTLAHAAQRLSTRAYYVAVAGPSTAIPSTSLPSTSLPSTPLRAGGGGPQAPAG